MTRTKSSRALLSVVLAVLMAAAFMPSLTYSSFAATAKKATKVTKASHADKAKFTRTVGTAWTLKYKLSPSKLTSSAKKVTWKSSNSKVVKITTIKSGKAVVSFKSAGTATVTVATKANPKAKTSWKFKVVNKTTTKKVAATGVSVKANNSTDYTKTLTVGTVLSATVAPSDATGVTYQWYADDQAISGATGNEFTVTADQIGKVITVKAKANTGDEVTSTASAKVAKSTLTSVTVKNSNGVAVSTAKSGDVLTADVAGTYTDNNGDSKDIDLGNAVTYQWYRLNADESVPSSTNAISGATSQKYTVTDADQQYKLVVVATAKDGISGYPVKSTAVSIAKAQGTNGLSIKATDTGLEAVVKNARGEVVDTTGWTFQWATDSRTSSSFTAISGQTSATLPVAQLTSGRTYKVTVTGTHAADVKDASATIVYSGKILNKVGTLRNNTAVLAGRADKAAQVGDELQVTGVTGTDSDMTYGTDYTVSWYRAATGTTTSTFNTVQATSLGTSATYKLTSADAGSTIVAVVNGAGSYAGQEGAVIIGGTNDTVQAATTTLTLSYNSTTKKLVVKDADGKVVTDYTVVKIGTAAPDLTFDSTNELINVAASLEGYSYYVTKGTAKSNKITFSANGTATAEPLTAGDIA